VHNLSGGYLSFSLLDWTFSAGLAVGATMVNLSRGSRKLFQTLSGTDPPYITAITEIGALK